MLSSKRGHTHHGRRRRAWLSFIWWTADIVIKNSQSVLKYANSFKISASEDWGRYSCGVFPFFIEELTGQSLNNLLAGDRRWRGQYQCQNSRR